jgi:hypothetical protein
MATIQLCDDRDNRNCTFLLTNSTITQFFPHTKHVSPSPNRNGRKSIILEKKQALEKLTLLEKQRKIHRYEAQYKNPLELLKPPFILANRS